MLDIGAKPNLSLVDTGGSEVERDSASAGTFIYFMRALICPQCNAAVMAIKRESSTFNDADVRVVIAVPEDRAAAAAWKSQKDVPFDVVVGKAGTAHAEVGLLRKVFGLVQQSGSILLDHEGVVRYAHASTNPGGSYNREEVARAIAALPAAP